MQRAVLFGLLVAAPAAAAAPADANALYARITEAYMDGRWHALEKDLSLASAPQTKLTAAQKADVAYLREALAECNPTWWSKCTEAKKAQFRATLWGRKYWLSYDPAAKRGLTLSFGPLGAGATLSWDPDELRDNGSAEGSMGKHGFTTAQMANLKIWSLVAAGAVWSEVSVHELRKLDDAQKVRLQQYIDFRANLTCLYYARPPARRAALVICLAAFLPKYGAGPMGGSRRAAGALLVAEVLAEPGKWPSLRPPRKVSGRKAEADAAKHWKFSIGPAWTIAEDRAFRRAVAAFAAANGESVRKTGLVTLPNGLSFHLDEESDKPLREKRNAWVLAQLAGAGAK